MDPTPPDRQGDSAGLPIWEWSAPLPPQADDAVADRRRRLQFARAWLLLALTFVTTTSMGAFWSLATRTDALTDLPFWLTPKVLVRVWTNPALLKIGLSYSLPLLFILGCHEMGHYLACRKYRLDSTPPYFIPIPLALGTFGAFIRIRTPIRSKNELFDVGVAGPLAGFVALLPFLLYGVARSQPAPLHLAGPASPATGVLFLPGKSLAMVLAAWPFHGFLPHDTILDLHPFAVAAWVGLFATSLNLLPLGQLDGGHILYAVFGRWQRRIAWPLWLALTAAGFFWPGWLLWSAVVLVIGLYHPPVWDEAAPLSGKRKILAVAAGLLLVLTFMPVPLSSLLVS